MGSDTPVSAPEIHGARVDFDGLLEVLGNNLYSTPTVVLRELVQNAHDSCSRRIIEDPACAAPGPDADPDAADAEGAYTPRIDVRGEPGPAVLTITDNGAGLTHDEIIRYLATVGAGYTRVLRQRTGKPELIGTFGLGFLSAYVVAQKVEVITTSYQQPDQTWRFVSKGGQGFTLEQVASEPIGSRVVLHLNGAHEGLAEPEALRALLQRYCVLLPLPIHAPEPVNDLPVPWREGVVALPAVRRARLELDFARRFEPHFEPLCTLPLGDGPAEGLLWVQDGATYGSSDNRRVVLFVRGMLITEDARELLPRWAGFVGGIVECDHLTPTASREDVQTDGAFQAVATQVAEALITGLAALAQHSPAAWRRVLTRHNEALLGAALVDDRLFALLERSLCVPTSVGDLPLPKVVQLGKGRLYVSVGDAGGPEDVLFRAMNVPIIDGARYAALPFTRRYGGAHGVQITELGTKAGDGDVFRPATDLAPAARARLEALLAAPDTRVEPVRFVPTSLPAVLVVDRDVLLKRRLQDDAADQRIAAGVLGLARMFTQSVQDEGRAALYVNVDSPVIQRVLALEGDGRQAQAATLVRTMAFLMSRQSAELAHDMGPTLGDFTAALQALIGPVADG